MFQTLHFQQRIKRIILIHHAARRCISLMPQAATNGIEWLHSAFVFIRSTFRCIVHCINSSYSKYSLLKKASVNLSYSCFLNISFIVWGSSGCIVGRFRFFTMWSVPCHFGHKVTAFSPHSTNASYGYIYQFYGF